MVPVIVVTFVFLYLFHPDLGTYSDGYRMGTITDFGPKGVFITTYEGDMHLGYNSQPWNDPDTGIPSNPWKYSAYASAYHAYLNMPPKKHVYVYYNQVWLQLNKWSGLTDYRVLSVAPTDPSLAPAQCGDMTPRSYMSGLPTGYLVKDSEKGNTPFTKTWEIQIQKGDGGGSPMNLSITDPALKACADLFVKSGVLAQFNYDTSLIPNPQRDTYHSVIGIRRVEDN